jgi:hypothetical protein
MNDTTILHKDLGKRMPLQESMSAMTAWEYFSSWNTFAAADVWTTDGWLITAACGFDEDGVHFLSRSECQQRTVYIKHDSTVYYVPNAQTKSRGFE